MVGRRSDGGERTIEEMTGKTTDGATKSAIKHSNTRIGEHVDPWGQEFVSKEAHTYLKKDGGNSEWGHRAIKHGNIALYLAAIHLRSQHLDWGIGRL